MAKGIAAVGAAAAAIGTAVVAGLGYAVSQADEAKGALNDFCAATGTATEDAGQYKQVMENIYNANFGEGFEDIAAAMAEVRQQAGDLGADELEKMFPIADASPLCPCSVSASWFSTSYKAALSLSRLWRTSITLILARALRT